MKYFQGTLDFYTEKPTAVTLGKFDGVHRGHQKLMQYIRSLEQGSEKIESTVFALNSRSGSLLLTQEEQKEAVERLGISCLIECPFLPEISGMSPEEFVREILVKRLHARYVAVGSDFHFGHNRQGDVGLLIELQNTYGFQTKVFEKEKLDDREISSTYTREALGQGDMELVTSLLGHPFPVTGTVLHGRQIGRTLGLPTINLIPPAEKLLPPNGVYASKTMINGRICSGITNIGYKPTVGEKFRGVETYLFDVHEDLYGKEAETQLYCFERPEQKFASLDELKAQIERDVSFGREYFGE